MFRLSALIVAKLYIAWLPLSGLLQQFKKRWQEYTGELYKKDLNDLDNHNGVVTHLEPDILECEVKWAIGNITMNKPSGGHGIPAELFQILKDMTLLQCSTQYASKFGKLSSDQRTGKGQFSFQSQRRKMAKNVQTTTQLCSFHVSKVMFKILQARLQQYVNWELPDVRARFRKGRGARDQIEKTHWIIEKAREFQKNIYFCFIDNAKALTVWITRNCGKFFKRWEYQTTLPVSWETCMQVKKQQFELDMGQQTGSKLWRE